MIIGNAVLKANHLLNKNIAHITMSTIQNGKISIINEKKKVKIAFFLSSEITLKFFGLYRMNSICIVVRYICLSVFK